MTFYQKTKSCATISNNSCKCIEIIQKILPKSIVHNALPNKVWNDSSVLLTPENWLGNGAMERVTVINSGDGLSARVSVAFKP